MDRPNQCTAAEKLQMSDYAHGARQHKGDFARLCNAFHKAELAIFTICDLLTNVIIENWAPGTRLPVSEAAS